MLAVDVKKDKASQGINIAAGFVNLNERKMLVTEFTDNEHLAGLESLIIQMNASSNEAHFGVLINMQSQNLDPHTYDKLHDLLACTQVEYLTVHETRNDLPPG